MTPRTHGQCPTCGHYGSDCHCHEARLGPWRVAQNEWNLRGKPWSEAIGIEYADAENLAQAVPGVVCWTTRGGDVEGNARLIAAAPELLAALERLSEVGFEGADPRNKEIVADALAAIAKATGQ